MTHAPNILLSNTFEETTWNQQYNKKYIPSCKVIQYQTKVIDNKKVNYSYQYSTPDMPESAIMPQVLAFELDYEISFIACSPSC